MPQTSHHAPLSLAVSQQGAKNRQAPSFKHRCVHALGSFLKMLGFSSEDGSANSDANPQSRRYRNWGVTLASRGLMLQVGPRPQSDLVKFCHLQQV